MEQSVIDQQRKFADSLESESKRPEIREWGVILLSASMSIHALVQEVERLSKEKQP